MQAGRMMRCWHQQLRGRVLGFHTSSSWARSLQSHRIVHPARLWGSASLSGPCCPQCLRAKLTLPNTPPSLPLCPASFATPFHSGLAPACQEEQLVVGRAELTSHLLHLRDKSSLFPLPCSNLFHNDGKMLLPKAQTRLGDGLCAHFHPAEPMQIQFFRRQRSCSVSYNYCLCANLMLPPWNWEHAPLIFLLSMAAIRGPQNKYLWN